MAKLTPELEAAHEKIKKLAKEAGLDFFETIFEIVKYNQLNEIAAKGGFPTRYPHWRFGMEYDKMSKNYKYGLSKIYELVINTDPCYAYLLEGNAFLDQKLVMAHVYGHCDFFKNNKWFAATDRKMMDTMANHSTRIRRYIDRYGYEEVESFIDVCLSLENLIDRYSPYAKKEILAKPQSALKEDNVKTLSEEESIKKVLSSWDPEKANFSDECEGAFKKPKTDVLSFLLESAPLENWQHDVLSLIRDEAYYFTPQGMTKTMNEGWASYWHARLMTEEIMGDCDIIDFADMHSGAMVMAPNGYNPYKVGIELFRDIKNRWDKGRHGLQWSECSSESEKKNWDDKSMKGMEKIFEVRRDYNDVSFIDAFLTKDFCVKNKMFVYKFDKKTNQFVCDTSDFKQIKAQLLFQLSNFGQPTIKVVHDNFNGKKEMLLGHLFEGVELQPDYMEAAMTNLYKLWKRPVHLVTVMDGEKRLFTYNGEAFSSKAVSDFVAA